MTRAEAESGLEFVGFFVFENKLKHTTAGVIHELNEAGIRNVMCTGDNILTAISVARECNLLDRSAHCFVPRFLTGANFSIKISRCAYIISGDPQTPHARLRWESIDNQIHQLDEQTLMVVTSNPLFVLPVLTRYSPYRRLLQPIFLYRMMSSIFVTTQ